MWRLSDREHRIYIESLCWACKFGQNGSLGFTLNEADRVFRVFGNVSETLQETLQSLLQKRLLCIAEDDTLSVPTWEKRQYKSDSSTKRVKKHRKNNSESTSSDKSDGTFQKRSIDRYSNGPDTDTDTELKAHISESGKNDSSNAQAMLGDATSMLQASEGSTETQTPEVEFPPSFPKTESDAKAAAAICGVPEAFSVDIWNKAASRGGRDAKDVIIRSWPHYLKTEFGYEKNRQEREKQQKTSKFQKPRIVPDHDKGF